VRATRGTRTADSTGGRSPRSSSIATPLDIVDRTEHLPIDFALFSPESWTSDAERRQKAKVPSLTTFKTKHDLALEMIEQAALDGIPGAPSATVSTPPVGAAPGSPHVSEANGLQ
jgi:hypothetical protein